MEFHVALKNILKYQGKGFLSDPKIVNALMDFQAYELHPALKNIFKVLHSEGYIAKLSKWSSWDLQSDKMIYEIERNYGFSHDIITYILKSCAYGIDVIQDINSSLAQLNNTTPDPSLIDQSKYTFKGIYIGGDKDIFAKELEKIGFKVKDPESYAKKRSQSGMCQGILYGLPCTIYVYWLPIHNRVFQIIVKMKTNYNVSWAKRFSVFKQAHNSILNKFNKPKKYCCQLPFDESDELNRYYLDGKYGQHTLVFSNFCDKNTLVSTKKS